MIFRKTCVLPAIACIALMLATGCSNKKAATPANFKQAIDTYYSARPECLWTTTVQFPTRSDTSDSNKTTQYDALTDQGLLTRQQDTRKVFIFGTKQVNDYDLAPKGRAAWTVDPTQPSYGNFCFGHRDVSTVDNIVANGGTATATYTYQLAGVAPWANTPEVKNAFPIVQAALAGPLSDKATFILGDSGWVVTKDTTSGALNP